MEESDPVWDDPVVPITITIDSSIDVVGNNNTVVLPSRAGSPTSTTSRPSVESDDGTASSAAAASAQQVRATKLGQVTAVIIAALREAGGLIDDLGRARQIQIALKSGIRIEGSENVISTGDSISRQVFTHSSRVATGAKRRAESVGPLLTLTQKAQP